MTGRRVLIAAGGTGGHVFPALAVAQALRHQGWHAEWVGSDRGLEARVIPAAGFGLHILKFSGVRGRGLMALLSLPFRLISALARAMAITMRARPDAVKVIDYTPELTVARAQAGYPILAPVGLSSDWRATSARWQMTDASSPVKAWHLGFVTPGEQYAQLGESATTNSNYIPEQTASGKPTTTSQVGGFEWQRYENSSAQRSLVRIENGVTIVVTGTADWPLLEEFAASLRS